MRIPGLFFPILSDREVTVFIPVMRLGWRDSSVTGSAFLHMKENARNGKETLPSNNLQPAHHLLLIWQNDTHLYKSLSNTQSTDPSETTTTPKSQDPWNNAVETVNINP